MREFIDLAVCLKDHGADIIEIGLPHSDPLADGPTIRYASHAVLSRGCSVESMFQAIAEVSKRVSLPIVAMCYINTVLRIGSRHFAERCKDAGVSGVVIADLTLEESVPVHDALSASEIALIHLAAPTTPKARIRRLAQASAGFLYLVSVTGITGARRRLPKETEEFISSARSLSPIPVCVGFGISSGRIARRLRRFADGVIVGSALLDRIRSARNARERLAGVAAFTQELRRGLDGKSTTLRSDSLSESGYSRRSAD